MHHASNSGQAPSAAPVAAAQVPGTARAPAAEAHQPVIVVSAPSTLRALEREGLDLGTQLVGRAESRASELSKDDAYRVIADTVSADLRDDRARDRAAGVGMRFAHRQFDARWLSSERARWELIAVVNRLDRRPFAPEYCGELRLVYRLAYRAETRTGVVDSRLPMTINLVRYQPAGDPTCREAARAWLGPEEASKDARWLGGSTGPLSSARLRAMTLKSVELNFQSVRWPSTVRPHLGGHAEYVLRAFHARASAPYLAPARLENTIDSERLGRDSRLRGELRAWLARPESLRAVDDGTLLVPEKFLAERAVSVSPHGLARRANRPYATVFDAKDFDPLPFTGSSVRSGNSLLRRLDGLSCPGCHQSRSLAGFHVLGEEPPDKRVDALHVPISAHVHGELARRRAYVAALAAGHAADDTRPPAERGHEDDGPGSRCGLGDAGYAGYTCRDGLRCIEAGDPEVGVCVPDAGPSVGDPCEHGPITDAPPHADTARLSRVACEGGRVCEANGVGFPGGMCAGSCDHLPPGSVCGGIAVLVEFNDCLARGRSFERCVQEHTRPGALRACSFDEPCRDDYVCARSGESGACMPPYFLFQLRVDGHPL